MDPGWGTAYLARVIGEKRAREMWFLCRRYTAHEALEMGLINRVVAEDELDAEVARWCEEILALSPTALAIAKASFNADTDSIKAVATLGANAVALYYNSPEASEAAQAFREKRRAVYRKKAQV